ncbi:Uncharacterised protein [Mycobacterium tuberculosis]|nr:Uncharacterised protein [Mycobacterium tuberculosis]
MFIAEGDIGRCRPDSTVDCGDWSPALRCHDQHSAGSCGRDTILSGSSGSGEGYTRSAILTTRLGTIAGGATSPCAWVARSAAAVVALTCAMPSGSTT